MGAINVPSSSQGRFDIESLWSRRGAESSSTNFPNPSQLAEGTNIRRYASATTKRKELSLLPWSPLITWYL